ncbi:hypothetical protein D3C78_1453400 [compost metagenome]
MFHGSRAAGGDHWHMAHGPHFLELLQIIAVTHTILVHHIQDDFARAAFLHFLHPLQGFPLRHASTAFIARVLVNVVLTGDVVIPGINPHDDTLHAEALRKTRDQFRVCQGRGVDGNLISPKRQDFCRVVRRLDSTSDAEGNINHFGNACNPAFINHTAIA